MNMRFTIGFGLLLLTGCATGAPADSGPALDVPVFAADDARVGTAGFVGQTLRVHREQDGVRYTLMLFRVGDTWTLGAMVKGDFAGEVRWTIDGRGLRIPFTTSAPAGKSQVYAEPGGAKVATAENASFRGTAWTNVEMPAGCMRDGSHVQLQFVPANGAAIDLPEAGGGYTVHQVAR
ncbi:MAG: hypothetical protein H6838_06455 [Planctomycetes bacterium]|nr:hypothetical protein [Planctomycetota bacterium]